MLLSTKDIIAVRLELIRWYNKNKRPLPFRTTKDPYKIWLSEIMAQQTTMLTVLDYYSRFIKRFSTIKDVAVAPEAEVLKNWQGLGYYARCRNFYKACQDLVCNSAGQIPTTYQGLLSLKGVGDYTAAAIASICFDEPRVVIDGNVKRVLARLFNYKKNIDSLAAGNFIKQKAQLLMDTTQPGTFNQAMMELGALVCQKSPQCFVCPVKKYCAAKDHEPHLLPIKNKIIYQKIEYVSLVLSTKKLFVLRPPCSVSLIKDMWELPMLYDTQDAQSSKPWHKLLGMHELRAQKKLGVVRHAITNKRILVHVYAGQINSQSLTKLKRSGFKAMSVDEIRKLPLNTISSKIFKKYYNDYCV